jgi:hypothetical protein
VVLSETQNELAAYAGLEIGVALIDVEKFVDSLDPNESMNDALEHKYSVHLLVTGVETMCQITRGDHAHAVSMTTKLRNTCLSRL